jgi:hypothetical protein
VSLESMKMGDVLRDGQRLSQSPLAWRALTAMRRPPRDRSSSTDRDFPDSQIPA